MWKPFKIQGQEDIPRPLPWQPFATTDSTGGGQSSGGATQGCSPPEEFPITQRFLVGGYDELEWSFPGMLSYQESSHLAGFHYPSPGMLSYPGGSCLDVAEGYHASATEGYYHPPPHTLPLPLLSSPFYSPFCAPIADSHSHHHRHCHKPLTNLPPTTAIPHMTNHLMRRYYPDPKSISLPSKTLTSTRRRGTSALAAKRRNLRGIGKGYGGFPVPTPLMRYKRQGEKMGVWDAEDIRFLKDAKYSFEKQQWELISKKMLELGCKKKIPAATCVKKWKEMNPGPANASPREGSAG